MKKYVWVLGVVLAMSVVAGGSVLDDVSSSLGADWTRAMAPAINEPLLFQQRPLGDLLTMKTMRPMDVTVTPEWPRPFEEVVATVSGKTSDPYLTLDDATVSRHGSDIVIDLEWSTHASSSIILFNGLCCSAGYGIEQVRPAAFGTPALRPYEVTRSLGAFDVGRYRIRVYSRGALEGEAQTTFEVRASTMTIFDLLSIQPRDGYGIALLF
ncbi:MAG: hypothetical protein JW993_04515 [Sedimentisphaerales bacterium]|nr:hypothetical protein [Sedimentisphaerales bacterium]